MIDQEIYDLMERFGRSHLSGLKLSTENYTIELTQGAPAAPVVQAAVPAAAPSPVPVQEAPVKDAPAVTAPMPGTFYLRPAPDQAPFVQVGDKVAKGDTLCLLEAMKMMSEIPAPCDLVVEEIVQEDGAFCAFGDALIRYRAV